MGNPTIHLCIVSKMPLANLIPILQYRPEHVALAISAGMKQEGENFRKLLVDLEACPQGRVHTYPIPEHGIEQIREAALQIEADLQTRLPGCRITYNATGGTKLMALAFAELLGGGNNQVIYTDTARHCIETLHPQPATQPMQSVLNLQAYLRAHGKRLGRTASDDPAWRERAQTRKKLTLWLAGHAGELGTLFGALNNMAQHALAQHQRRGEPPRIAAAGQGFTTPPWGVWLEAMEKIAQARCCQWDAGKPETVYFHDPEGAKYLSGGWLEEFVWLTLNEAKPEEFKAGAEFTDMARPRDDVRNELDGIAAHRNRLLLVECKTANLGEGVEAIYKLDSIGHDMGLFQKRLLVSARPLDGSALARANNGQIDVVQPENLMSLKNIILSWMGIGSDPTKKVSG